MQFKYICIQNTMTGNQNKKITTKKKMTPKKF